MGVIQGITEWLPVSSEGINTLISLQFFKQPLTEAISISLWLHGGTLLAALFYFRQDIIALLRYTPSYFQELRTHRVSEPTRLINFLIITAIVSGALGTPLLFLSLSEESVPAALATAVIGGLLIITGLVQKYALKSVGSKTITTAKDAILVGLVQGLSVLPGFSRSGLTVSTLLFRGYHAKRALRFSFLMSIPIMLGMVVVLGIIEQVYFNLPILIGMVTALIFGWLTIGALLRVAERIPFWIFCLILGGLSLLPLIIETFLT